MAPFFQPSPTTKLPPRPPSAAEMYFKSGVELARGGRFHEALEPLEQAMAYSVSDPGAAFLKPLRSWYGLVVAMARGDVVRGRRLCEEAIADTPRDPELYLNLAQVFVRAGRRDLAMESLNTALAIDRHFKPSWTLLEQLGRRRPPVFRFLRRGHPFNKWAGRLRHRYFTRR